MNLKQDIDRVLLTQQELREKIHELGTQISKDYEGKNLLLVSVLKGSLVFVADLMREITIHCGIDFMNLASYGSETVSSGKVRILKDLDINITGFDILIVEDILDSGRTLAFLKQLLVSRNPRSVQICTLLYKPDRQEIMDISPDYTGFVIPDEFVVGFGLDYNEKYRNLPYIAVLKPEVYTS